jgi:hypothetical protein
MLSLALDGYELLSLKRLSTAALPLCEMRTSVCMYLLIRLLFQFYSLKAVSRTNYCLTNSTLTSEYLIGNLPFGHILVGKISRNFPGGTGRNHGNVGQ